MRKLTCFAALAVFCLSWPCLVLSETVVITPSEITAPDPGQTIILDITIQGARDLFGFEFDLSYDPEFLEFASSTEGDFLQSMGNTFAVPPLVFGTKPKDDGTGVIRMGVSRLGGAGVNGDGQLAQLEFIVIKEPDVQILMEFQQIALFDSQANKKVPENALGSRITPSIRLVTVTATTDEYGGITPAGEVILEEGENLEFTIAADPCYHIEDVLVDGASVGSPDSYTFSNLESEHTIRATFAVDTHAIIATAGANGSITPSGTTTTDCSASQTYNILPEEGYKIADVLVDSKSVGTVTTYTFTNVTGDHDISVTFSPICVKGDVNRDGSIRSNDAILALQISAGILLPTPEQECAADINDDGKTNSVDAILILLKVAGLAAPDLIGPVVPTNRPITVALDRTYSSQDSRIALALIVDNPETLAGGDISIVYNRSVFSIMEVRSPFGVMMSSDMGVPGVVRISFASTHGLYDNTIATIEFDILSDDLTQPALKMVELYDRYARPINLRVAAILPDSIVVFQNYPNPFNPDTWIPYELGKGNGVAIRIYNVSGFLIRTLDLGHKPSGFYTDKSKAAYWDGKNQAGEQVSSGVYFYTIQAGEFTATRKMVVVK